MRVFLVVASVMMLASAEPPTSYSHRSSGPNVSFQPVPSVAQIHIPSTSSQSAPQSHYASIAQSRSSSPHVTSYASASSASPSYAAPQQSYGAPQQQQQQQQYAAPQQQQYLGQQSQQQNQYGAPSHNGGGGGGYQGQSQQANIQVSYGGAPPPLPPGASYGPPPVVTGAGPDHDIEYRVVYVKGPKPRQPDLVLPPPPPKQKTIVYILVPRVEAPEPIIVPTHAPTPPSKPEVYFIRYKATKKNNNRNAGGNSIPSGQYGAPSAPKPVVVDAPPKKREVEVTVTSSSSKESMDKKSGFSFGDRVRDSN